MALKRQPTTPCTLPGARGLTTSREEVGLVGGAQEEVPSQPWYHT